MEGKSVAVEVEQLLDQLGVAALKKVPCRIKFSLQELTQVPWIEAEFDIIKQGETSTRSDQKEAGDDMVSDVLTIREVQESYAFSQKDVEEGIWVRNLIRKALRTKPIDAKYITFTTM